MINLSAKAYFISYLLIIILLLSGCSGLTEKIASKKNLNWKGGTVTEVTPFPEETTGIIWTPITDSYSKKALTSGGRHIFKRPDLILADVSDLKSFTGSEFQAHIRLGLNNGTIKLKDIAQYPDLKLIRIKERQADIYHGNEGVIATLEITVPPALDKAVITALTPEFTINSLYHSITFNYKLIYPIVADREKVGNVPEPDNADGHRTEWGYIAPVVIRDDENSMYRMWYTKVNTRFDSSKEHTNLFDKYRYEYITEYTYSPLGSISWAATIEDKFSSGLSTSTSGTLGDKGGMVVFDAMKTTDYYYLWYIAKDSANYDFKGSFNHKDPIQGRTWKIYSAYLDDRLAAWKRHDMGSLLLTLSTGSSGFDSSSIHKGSILYEPESLSYKLWYTGSNGGSLDIGRATTFNGLTGGYKDKEREIYKGRERAFDSRDIADPFILKDGKLYKMWYSGYNGFNWRIGMAYSWDGLNFTYYDEENYQPLELSGDHNNPAINYRFPCVVEEESGNYLLFYSKQNSDGTWQIEVSRSERVIK